MRSLQAPLLQSDTFCRMTEALKKEGSLVRIENLTDSARGHLTDALGASAKTRVIVTYSDKRAAEIAEDYTFYDRDTVLFPAKDLIFYEADIHAGEIMRRRMQAIRKIIEGGRLTLVTTLSAFMTPQLTPDVFRAHTLRIEKGKPLPVKDMAAQLVTMGYQRTHQVEGGGQFAVRGDIIDIFDLTMDNPVRIERWGDEVDSIRLFDRESQRSIEPLAQIDLFPAREMILTTERLERGLKIIEDETADRVSALYESLHTEEAARLRRLVDTLKEELLTLSVQVNLEPYIRYFYEEVCCLADLFDTEDTLFVIDDPARCLMHARAVEEEFRESMTHRASIGFLLPGQMDLIFPASVISARLARFRRVQAETLLSSGEDALFGEEEGAAPVFSFEVQGIAPYNNSFDTLIKDLKRYRREGYCVVILSGSRSRAKRLVEDLRDHDVTAFYAEDPNRVLQSGEIMTYYGRLRQGFAYTALKLAVISESDIFTVKKEKKRKKKRFSGDAINDFSDLKIGDYVVHEDHGIGIYRGVEQVEVEKTLKDYLKIEYADGGNLYIAATGLSVIQKYASGEAGEKKHTVKCNRLGSGDWARAKAKVRSALDEVAQDLIALYAARSKTKGYAFGADTVWQQEFEEAFPYEETADQLAAIAEMKKDMESAHVMDRLLCGDVGFGKTEVAIRGAFKAVQDSKQVAVLVPTTILAQQHYNTFQARLRDFPVRIALLSRFRTAREQKKTIEDLKTGVVDIVIGTHRLLSGDVAYKDLGLLIVDEEQRFGVRHKEKIKQIKTSVDVLTLSATPIPRTLHMSLIGIRDMSLLTEPPSDRLPIQTFVCEHNDAMVREAVMRELSRGGQVYYVYNRVNTIADVTARLKALVPEARIAFAHGQMQESELEKIMYDFIAGDIDVLVSTVIIETGLDIPNVNTMIVHDSDKMGLAQLYQLRGRVGRSSRTAYAFLMYKRERILREVAEKRLNAIREFTDLGSGYRIAMRDLEIRGAGNLLGTRQSGHMAAVGYEMYCRMLEEALKTLKGEMTPAEAYFSTGVDLNVDAYIPETYILNEEQKLEIYKRIAALTDATQGEEIRDELTDRFGALPASVDNLIRISYLRMRAHALYITDIRGAEKEITFSMKPDAPIDPAGIPQMIARYRGALAFHSGVKPAFTYRSRRGDATSLLVRTEEIITSMEATWGIGA